LVIGGVLRVLGRLLPFQGSCSSFLRRG